MSSTFKQPHEDIQRPYGADPLLSLEEAAIPYRNALITMTRILDGTTLVGHPAPVVEHIYERCRKPQPGDLVVEWSGFFRRDPDAVLKSFGRLILCRKEWWETDEQWEADKAEDGGLTDEDRMTDDVWYIQYGPDHVCRWTNCMFTVVPADFTLSTWDGISFTRDAGQAAVASGAPGTRDDA